MKINVTCWTGKWITWSWWKNRVPQCRFRNPSASQHWSVLDHLCLLPQNLFHSVLSVSRSSSKEHIRVFLQQQPITASTSLYFSHLRTCSSPVFRYFHHIILLFELPDSFLPTLLYWKWCFNNAICLHAGLLLVSPAGKQVYAGRGAHVEGMGAHVEQKILSS